MDPQTAGKEHVYRIAVQGRLDENWSNWFSGMSMTMGKTDEGVHVTVLTGPVVDQPALRAILNRLWDLNLLLISVQLILEGSSNEEANR